MNLQEFLDLTDRYLAGELSEEQMRSFEAYRRENPAFEQKFQEHVTFVQEINGYARRDHFKSNLTSVIDREQASPAILVKLWRSFRINGVAAAAVAIISSVATLFMTGYFSTIKKTTTDYSALRREMNTVKRNVNAQNNAIKNISNTGAADQTIHYGATGFLLNRNGYVVTNYHVVNGADSVYLQNSKGLSYKANILYKDADKDLAILHINDSTFRPERSIPYSFNTYDVELGEGVFTIGYPRDEAVYGEGYLSSATGYGGDTLAYQISIPVNPGNSGGPVFDHYGNIIGIISGKQKGIDGAGFAIKTKALQEALLEIPADSLKGNLYLNTKNAMSGLSRTEQIKRLQEYIYIIKVF